MLQLKGYLQMKLTHNHVFVASQRQESQMKSGEVFIMTLEWPGPKSKVPNMVITQPLQNGSL